MTLKNNIECQEESMGSKIRSNIGSNFGFCSVFFVLTGQLDAGNS